MRDKLFRTWILADDRLCELALALEELPLKSLPFTGLRYWGAWVWVGALKLCLIVSCLVAGHRPVDDHCMKPEHRFCYLCNRPTPNAEPTEW